MRGEGEELRREGRDREREREREKEKEIKRNQHKRGRLHSHSTHCRRITQNTGISQNIRGAHVLTKGLPRCTLQLPLIPAGGYAQARCPVRKHTCCAHVLVNLACPPQDAARCRWQAARRGASKKTRQKMRTLTHEEKIGDAQRLSGRRAKKKQGPRKQSAHRQVRV